MPKRAGVILFAALLANPAFATFELEDPAAEFAKDTPESNAEALAKISCHDFLVGGVGNSSANEEAIGRIYAYYRHRQPGGESPPREAGIKAFCIDNPKKNLVDATDAQMQ